MIKAVLMDLGKTIFTNEKFSFKKGLIETYKKFDYINNYCSLESFLDKADSFMYLYYERDKTNIEIPFTKYISLVLDSLNITNYNLDIIEDYFLKEAMTDNLMPNVIDFLIFLKTSNIPIIIVSNSSFSERALFNELKIFNIENYFESLISSANILYRKPIKEIFDYAYSKLKEKYSVSKNEVLFVGNDYNLDALGSLNAGLVPAFYNIENITISNDIYTFTNYLDLIEYIKRA